MKSSRFALKTSSVIAAAILIATGANARPLGTGVTSFNGTVNWASVFASGVKFGYARATDGSTFNDPNYNTNMKNGKAAGLIMGPFHFAEPAADAPSTDANHFFSTAKSQILNDGATLMPMLDFEIFNGHSGATSYTDWANKWGSNVATKMNNNGHTCHYVMYVGICSACNFDSSIVGYSWLASFNGQDPQTGTPWSSCTSCEVWGPGVWTLWNYCGDCSVPGISGDASLDVYNGTLAQMKTQLLVQPYP